VLKDESNGKPLIAVLEGHTAVLEGQYEQSVEDALVALAQSWSTNIIEKETLDTLRGQTRSVLQGEDPVLKLLDERMQQIFCELGVDNMQDAPVGGMKTGLGVSNIISPHHSPFVTKARCKFADRGLAFYATDLAEASELATKVSKLAFSLYGEQFLDSLVLGLLAGG